MTVTDIEPTRLRRRERTCTDASSRLGDLQAMLTDPTWEPYRDEIQRAILHLTATSVLAA